MTLKWKEENLLSGNKSDTLICCVMATCMFFRISLVKKKFCLDRLSTKIGDFNNSFSLKDSKFFYHFFGHKSQKCSVSTTCVRLIMMLPQYDKTFPQLDSFMLSYFRRKPQFVSRDWTQNKWNAHRICPK